MNVVYERCAGLDVHKRTVVVCASILDSLGQRHKERQTFGTMMPDLLRLRQWLNDLEVTHVAMESTANYWKPIFNVLESHLEVLVVNAQHLKAVPGRKTDLKDAEWIADLLQHGLLNPSFIPPAPQREVRELTRYRMSLTEERTRLINRLQQTLEEANIKLASVASDVMGRSARDMLTALLAGEADATVLAELARGRMRAKRDLLAQALHVQLKPHHCFLIGEQLADIDTLDEGIERMNTEIAERLRPYEHQIQRLSTIPGIKRRLAEVILAEIGPDMNRFPDARHLASWAGMCPGNNESGGKRLNGKTRKGSPWLRSALVEAAHAATHCKDSYLSAQYQRLVVRRGGKKATIAIGHTLLVIIYHILSEDEDYEELGGNDFDEWDRQAVQKRLVRRLEKLGYEVKLEPTSPAA
ncbi:IS110 family transposase [Ktedonobacter sp. SOSP1-52]|uniref:IS110 family transposase n=1 Tax=Ktedonobacter sp. SOSP1-52 TaxID=2778366 RepID=UPI001914E18D|nr:IS110 family transposase [Ktedonobacter sp. SOSP1-52]GHO71826.1 IS110 family transposase [Ktedonobacter sp. SOSP1-52]GHO71833.1 IS110 family transposase [Ktedonobacter sp. SOSP1-52]